jgi:hypothetical protein
MAKRQYEVEVTEIRSYARTYLVEATSEAEALKKAATGDTISEDGGGTLNDFEVMDRIVESDPVRVDG